VFKSRQNTRHLRLRAGSPSTGCTGPGSDKWQSWFARWKVMESSITLSCDTCYLEFDLGWVIDAHSPSGSMDYQLEYTNQKQRIWLMTLSMPINGSLSMRSRGWNFDSLQGNVDSFLRGSLSLLGDLLLYEVLRELFHVKRMMLGRSSCL